MPNNFAGKRLLEKMFEALLRERISKFAKKYGQESVVQTWAEIVKSGGFKAYSSKWEWNPHTKIIDALDYLDDYCDSVESTIQATINGKGKNELRLKILG